MLEKDLQAQVLRYLHMRGIFAWKSGTGAFRAIYKEKNRYIRFGMRGQPDILGLLPGGRFLGLEIKTQKGKVSAYQNAFLALIRKHGGVGEIIRSVHECHALITQVQGGSHGPLEPVAPVAARSPADDRRAGYVQTSQQ